MAYGQKRPEDAVSKQSFGSFGLNQGTLVSFDLVQDEQSSANYLHLVVKINESEYQKRFYEPTQVYYSGVQIDKTHTEYEKQKDKAEDDFSAAIVHIVEAFVPRAKVDATLAPGIADFKDFANKMTNLVATSPDKDKPVDIFLQWQSKVVNDKQYLEIPNRVGQGLFIVPHVAGNFKENRDGGTLRYLNELGEVHPISRSAWFMDSANGKKVEVPAMAGSSNFPEGSATADPNADPFANI
jgi:hypothetical protein